MQFGGESNTGEQGDQNERDRRENGTEPGEFGMMTFRTSIEFISEQQVRIVDTALSMGHTVMMELQVTDSANRLGANRTRNFFGNSDLDRKNIRSSLKDLQTSILVPHFTYAVSDILICLRFPKKSFDLLTDSDLSSVCKK